MKPYLSKSKILSGLQCPKKLYLEKNHPDYGKVSGQAVAIMASGTAVGELAMKEFPGGVLIDEDSLSKAMQETLRYMKEGKGIPLYEATFNHDGILIRADILVPSPGGLDPLEVKSSTTVKDYHLIDVAIQTWVLRESGYQVNKSYLVHIDNSFVYMKEGDYTGLFKHVDVTEEVDKLLIQVPGWAGLCRAALSGGMPEMDMGPHCSKPFECQFKAHCMPDDQPKYPVSSIPYGGNFVKGLLADGIEDICDIPEDRLNNDKNRRIWNSVKSGKVFLDPRAATEISKLTYPLYYIDFETIQFVMPIWLGTRPYEQLPFQWSCHIEDQDGSIKHKGFLGDASKSPMREFTETLLEAIGDVGAVIVYNEGFEKRILKEMAIMFPEYAQRIQDVLDRVVDLLKIARNHYYHPDMQGSWSIKKVLPTIDKSLDYSNLEEVQDGGGAQKAFLEMIDSGTDSDRSVFLRERLEAYCKLDTWAMVSIKQCFTGEMH